jgi:hypothetical protein
MKKSNKNNIKNTLDNEWAEFISFSKYDLGDDLDEEMEDFDGEMIELEKTQTMIVGDDQYPNISDIYISTKTKIAYLNQEIDLKTIFWKIPIIEYARPENGVIKKQIKFNSLLQEELTEIEEYLKQEKYYEEYVITSINNPNGRIKFKDIRKVTVGISKKDLMSYRCKKKSAFYNCFVVILRIKVVNTFKEFHVKVFNTGKVEIPGVQLDESYEMICKMMIELLQPHVKDKLEFKNKPDNPGMMMTETVLINSNFNAGFYINREKFFDILQMKYNLHCIYDPCSYPGIQCKIYYSEKEGIMKSKENEIPNPELFKVSFMIFRTGSVLIVGKCDEFILGKIYEFLKDILYVEYGKIGQKIMQDERDQMILNKNKKKKVRRKEIFFNTGV